MSTNNTEKSVIKDSEFEIRRKNNNRLMSIVDIVDGTSGNPLEMVQNLIDQKMSSIVVFMDTETNYRKKMKKTFLVIVFILLKTNGSDAFAQ